MNFPKHLTDNPVRLQQMRRFANDLRAHYGVPIYFVGSALQELNADPRDWDLRICLPDEEFMRFYAPGRHDGAAVAKQWWDEDESDQWSPMRWRWADDCIKQSRRGWRITRLNIDFQTYPEVYWSIFASNPRVQLDTRDQ